MLVFIGGSSFQGFLGGAGFRPSTVGRRESWCSSFTSLNKGHAKSTIYPFETTKIRRSRPETRFTKRELANWRAEDLGVGTICASMFALVDYLSICLMPCGRRVGHADSGCCFLNCSTAGVSFSSAWYKSISRQLRFGSICLKEELFLLITLPFGSGPRGKKHFQ